VQDDSPQPHPTGRPETDREFETPQSVREIRPEPVPSDKTFQRRWEKVLTMFVVSGTRGRGGNQ
jgi:hypothetical protein